MSAIAPPPATTTLDYAPGIDPRFRYFRPRILFWSILGYAMFYFVRKNLSIAMPVIEEQLHIKKSSLGLFLTLHGLLYGVSKFANGIVGDRVNAKYFMAFGLVCSAGMNIAFGLSSAVVTLGVFWVLNGWFQGIGFPPCARLLTHWFSPKELATKMSIWNTSHGIGAGAVAILCGYLVSHYHDWRLCLFVPAALAVFMSVLLLIFLKDTPESVGLPPVEGTGSAKPRAAWGDLVELVFSNPYIWVFSVANFFVYTIRYAVLDWGPTLLKEYKHVDLSRAGWIVAGFEGSGLVGALCAGWLTDKVFGGKGARMCVVCMTLCAVAIYLFWRTPSERVWTSTAVLMFAGFFIYGPQALVGISAANLGTKRAAASAVGLTGLFGYASGILSGWGLGLLVEKQGWNAAFQALIVVAVIGIALFVLAWGAPRDGYNESGSGT